MNKIILLSLFALSPLFSSLASSVIEASGESELALQGAKNICHASATKLTDGKRYTTHLDVIDVKKTANDSYLAKVFCEHRLETVPDNAFL